MYPDWTEHDIIVEGSPVHYIRTGDGSKPVVVLAHGFSDSGGCWLSVARELEADYDLILPDARGHGRSARIQEGETIDRAADLANFIRALGLDHPVVGGHSMGASTAAQLEARFPGLARALILEDPAWRDSSPELADGKERPNPFQDWLLKIVTHSVDELIAGCRAQNPAWAEGELRPWAESKKQFDTNFFKLPNTFNTEWRGVVEAIHCPALLITADVEKGAIVTPQIAEAAAALNPRIRPVHLSGAGHNIRREQYAGFMKAVRAFLKESAQ